MTFIPTVGNAIGPIVVVFVLAALLALVLTPLVRRDRPPLRDRRSTGGPPGQHDPGAARRRARRLRRVPARRGVRSCSSTRAADFVPVPDRLLADGGRGAAARRRRGGRRSAPSTTCSTSARAGSCSARSRWRCGAVALGISIDFIANPLGGGPIRFTAGPVAAGLTIFWIVGMINSINWIDGLDGLSIGRRVHRRRDARDHQPDDHGRRASR